jgi:hypothetical protein
LFFWRAYTRPKELYRGVISKKTTPRTFALDFSRWRKRLACAVKQAQKKHYFNIFFTYCISFLQFLSLAGHEQKMLALAGGIRK